MEKLIELIFETLRENLRELNNNPIPIGIFYKDNTVKPFTVCQKEKIKESEFFKASSIKDLELYLLKSNLLLGISIEKEEDRLLKEAGKIEFNEAVRRTANEFLLLGIKHKFTSWLCHKKFGSGKTIKVNNSSFFRLEFNPKKVTSKEDLGRQFEEYKEDLIKILSN